MLTDTVDVTGGTETANANPGCPVTAVVVPGVEPAAGVEKTPNENPAPDATVVLGIDVLPADAPDTTEPLAVEGAAAAVPNAGIETTACFVEGVAAAVAAVPNAGNAVSEVDSVFFASEVVVVEAVNDD